MLLLFFLFFVVYLRGMCPTVYIGDSGEFIAAAKVLGIPHPPAYPLFVLLGRLFSLIPLANTAYRVNLLSGFFGALTVSGLYGLLRKIYKAKNIPFVVALIFGFVPIFFSEAVVSEVFTLHSFLAVTLLYMALSYRETGLFMWACLSVFVFGLSAGNHHTIIFIVPTLVILHACKLSSAQKERSDYGRHSVVAQFIEQKSKFLYTILLVAMGLSIYLLPLFRSKYEPLFNVGRPLTIEKLYRVFTRKDFGTFRLSLETEEKVSVEKTGRNITEYMKLKYRSFGVLPVLLSFAGMYFLFRRDKTVMLALFTGLFLSGIFFYVISNMPDTAQTWHLLKRFNIMPYIFFVLFIPAAVEAFTGFMGDSFRKTAFVSSFLLITLILRKDSIISKRNIFSAFDYGRNSLLAMKKNPVFIMDGGDDIFYTSAYIKTEYDSPGGQSPLSSIELYDTGGIVFSNTIYGRDYRALTRPERDKRREEIESRIIRKKGRPIYYATMNRKRYDWLNLDPAGLVFSMPPHLIPQEDIWDAFSERGVYSYSDDYRLRSVNAVLPYFKAQYFREKGDYKKYFRELRMTARYGDRVDWIATNIRAEIVNAGKELLEGKNYPKAVEVFSEYLNFMPPDADIYMYLGNAYIEQNRIEESREIYEKAVRLLPVNADIRVNLGVVYERLNMLDAAEKEYRRAVFLDDKNTNAHFNLSVIYWRQERWDMAVKELTAVRNNNPDDPRVARYLPEAILNLNRK